jgi:predicted amidophosphoribosyltransferase
MMFCPRCKKEQEVCHGVCLTCGYDITHPHNNEVIEKLVDKILEDG